MPKVALLNQTGKNIGDIELSDTVFNVEPNQQVLYEVVKAQRAAMRQGTHKTKGRSEVRGGGRKPWKQKGTGRARAGSTRSPIWVGGGTVFGPTPRDYSLKVNRKVRRLALKTVLTLKVRDEAFKVLDALSLESIQTKGMVEVLNNLNLSGKIMIILPEGNENVGKSARNIPGVVVTTVSHASVYEIMSYKNVITTVDAVKLYEEVLG